MAGIVERIARELRTMGYGHGEDIAAEDIATAAERAGFDPDPNDDHAMAMLADACRLVTGDPAAEVPCKGCGEPVPAVPGACSACDPEGTATHWRDELGHRNEAELDR